MQRITPAEHEAVIERCLRACLEAGFVELSLEQLAEPAGVTKRMLVHYFGSRQGIEQRAIAMFQQWQEVRFQPERFAATSFREAVLALWDSLTEPEFVPSLRLTYDLFRRSRKSERALQFHDRTVQLWTGVLLQHTKDRAPAEELTTALKAFAWAFLSGAEVGQCRAMLDRLASS